VSNWRILCEQFFLIIESTIHSARHCALTVGKVEVLRKKQHIIQGIFPSLFCRNDVLFIYSRVVIWGLEV